MSIRQALAFAGALLAAGTALAQPLAPPLSLQEALAAARDSIDVRIAGGAVAGAVADIAAADHAPLPQLSGKLSQIDLQNGIGPGNVFTDKRIDKSVGLDWTWERGDKRRLRTEAARRAAGAASADLDEARLQQQLAANAAFFDLLAAQGRVDELRFIERSAAETTAAAQARLRAGDVAVQDAARSEIELERARADTAAAGLDVQRAQIALARLIDRRPESLLARADWPEPVAMPSPPPPAGPGDPAIEARGDVRAAAERLQAAQAAAAGASAQRKADVTWGASFDHFPGTSTRQLEVRLAMPLTWGYNYEGEIGRAQAQLAQARDSLERTRLIAANELQKLGAELAAAAQRFSRYDTEIVPRSRGVVERAETAYRKGALPLTDLLDARRTLRTVLLEALAARSDLAKAAGAWQLRTRTNDRPSERPLATPP